MQDILNTHFTQPNISPLNSPHIYDMVNYTVQLNEMGKSYYLQNITPGKLTSRLKARKLEESLTQRSLNSVGKYKFIK